ncbi:O-antigen ligase family protein [Pseudoalteromonas sp. 1181_04]|uniref:O-antigen ligase family protein n=1 Tax=Pseudoalteromonas sp. 1181_04 TaxID=2604450 RepID=UPI0040645542
MGLFNEKRAFQSILLILCALLYFHSFKLEKKSKLILVSVLFIGLISTLLSENLLYSSLSYLHATMLISLVFLGYKIKDNNSILFYTIFFSNVFLVSYSLLNYSFFILSSEAPFPDGVLYGFYNIRFFNQFQVLSIPFVIYFLSHSKLHRVAKITLALNLFLLLFSSARGASIAILITTLIYCYFINKSMIKELFFCLLSATLLFLIHYFYLDIYYSSEYIIRTGSSNRYELWLEVINNINFKTLLIGNGPGGYKSEIFYLGHPHNSILQILNSWGAIVLSIVVLFIYKLITQSLAFINKNKDNNEFLTCFTSFVSLLIYSLVSGVIVMPIPQTFLFVLVGILLGCLGYNLYERKNNTEKKIALIITFAISLLYAALVILSYNCLDPKPHGPSFWSNGQLSFENCKLTYFEGS